MRRHLMDKRSRIQGGHEVLQFIGIKAVGGHNGDPNQVGEGLHGSYSSVVHSVQQPEPQLQSKANASTASGRTVPAGVGQ
jgi:hypothetical protein